MHPSAERLYKAAALLRHTTGQSAVARLLTQSPQVLKNWETRGVSKEGALSAQNELGASATWILDGRGAMEVPRAGAPIPRTAEPSVEGVAHEPILTAYTVPSLTTWEALTMQQRLPTTFRVAAPDDALGPRIPRGIELIMYSNAQPAPNQVILVRDAAGQLHLRRYGQGHAGTWRAMAPNPAYLDLESQRDGLQLLAVLRWVSGDGY